MTKEEAKRFGLQLLHGIMERNESYPVYANNVKQAIDALSETSGSSEIPNDLEEAARHSEILTYPMPEDGDIEKVFKVQEARVFHEIGFIAGAKWQKVQLMKDGNVILAEEDFDTEKEKSMEWGYNLCKEQMMKEAVEGEVVKDINNKLAVTAKNVNLDKFKFGERVRIIIVKEETDGTVSI